MERKIVFNVVIKVPNLSIYIVPLRNLDQKRRLGSRTDRTSVLGESLEDRRSRHALLSKDPDRHSIAVGERPLDERPYFVLKWFRARIYRQVKLWCRPRVLLSN